MVAFVSKRKTKLNVAYEITGGRVVCLPRDVVRHTIIPSDPSLTPRIIGWAGPARTGSTALLFLLASHHEIDRAYFQPIKSILRKKLTDFIIHKEDQLVCMKEVFGSLYKEENYDPIAILLEAGIPPEKITWLCLLREPVQAFTSWNARIPNTTPKHLYEAQLNTIELYSRYRHTAVRVIPFIYEFFENNEDYALRLLLNEMGVDVTHFSNKFDFTKINKKIVLGQAADKSYFDANLMGILERNQFVYSRNESYLPERDAKLVSELCRSDYDNFRSVCMEYFQLEARVTSTPSLNLVFKPIHDIN